MRPTNVVNEPCVRSGHRPPTLPEGEVPDEVKYDFLETFDRPPFIAQVDLPVYNRFKKRKLDCNGNKVYERKLRTHGMANPKFLEKNHLDYNSHPTE